MQIFLSNAGKNTLSSFSPERFLCFNLGVIEARTTTNGKGELEVYSLCKAQLSVVYDEVQRESGKKLGWEFKHRCFKDESVLFD